MNILFFLTPKVDVAYIYDTFSLRQVLEKMEYHKYSCIPVINEKGKYVDMEDLLDKAMRQNFVPVIDDQKNFIGIVTRRDIMQYICSSGTKEQQKV